MTGDLLVVKTILQTALHSCLPPFLPHRLAFGGWRGHLTGAAEDTTVVLREASHVTYPERGDGHS